MSEHQAILFLISVIVVTLMIWLGFGMFLDAHRAAQKDDFLAAMNEIGASAATYRSRPKTLGGGGGEYLGYVIPRNLSSIDAGTIFAIVRPAEILLVGHSSRGYGTVSAVVDGTGKIGAVSVEGDF